MDLGHQTLILFLYVLAVARMTRLINADSVLDPVRLIPAHRLRGAQLVVKEAVLSGQHARDEIFKRSVQRWTTLIYFLACPWCVGFWLCLITAIVPVRLIGWPWWSLFPVALAASHLIGVSAFAADTEEAEVVES
jgi:hypothetical protein